LSISLFNVATNGNQGKKTCDLGYLDAFLYNMNNAEIILKPSTQRENETISIKISNGMIKGF